MLTTNAFGVTATIHRRTGTYVDNPDGTSTPGIEDVIVRGCSVWPAGSTENTQQQDNVLTGLTLAAPAGTVIKSTDTVTIAGLVYQVVGDAYTWTSSLTGAAGHVQVALTRAH